MAIALHLLEPAYQASFLTERWQIWRKLSPKIAGLYPAIVHHKVIQANQPDVGQALITKITQRLSVDVTVFSETALRALVYNGFRANAFSR